ncbi:MAG: ATP-binding cassette domain-containing protein, partial [Pararhizobium sp.]
HMSVAENMGFSLKLAKCPKTEIDERVRQAADILALTALLERKPAQLSGGQRQRVAMGRAIVRNPKVFLFDEPLSNLDAKLRVQMRTEIKELHRRLGSTIVYVTHDQIEAMTMADRIVVMQGGYAQQIGRPLDIYDAPANTFVATFIGSPAMNLITGKIEYTDASGRLLCADGASISLDDPAIAAFAGETVTLGVRPEHLQLCAPGDLTAFTAEVTAVEPTGAETFVVMKHGGQEVTAVLRDRLAVEPGTHLELSIAKGKLHFFDAETGVRLAP